MQGVVAVNDEQFDRVVQKVVTAAGGDINGATVAAWGLTFKARTDDLRDSPALEIVARLLAKGARVQAFDPTVEPRLADRRAELPSGVEVAADPYAACAGAVALVVLTEWDEFKWLDFDKVGDAMTQRAVIDARNLLDREALRRRGFTYTGIGRD
jgi:UDPglucose 6-dehydrogenase